MAGPPSRALLLGCDSDGLKHCAADAERMAEALGQGVFEVHQCITTAMLREWCHIDEASPEGVPPRTPMSVVQDALVNFLDAGTPGETVLIYFSGHGHVAQDTFNLVVGTSRNRTGHVIDIERIAEPLNRYGNKASKRLLILDCCESGKATSKFNWNKPCGDRLRIWAATRSSHHAQELDGDTQGGLFTATIIRGLREHATRLARGGVLSIEHLERHVRKELDAHRSPSGDPAPVPSIAGYVDDNILFAVDLPIHKDRHGWSPALLADLHKAITDQRVDSTQAGTSYRYCRERAERGILLPPPDDVSIEGLLDVLSDPARKYFGGDRLKLPLVTFVAHLAQDLGQPESLVLWLRDARKWLEDGGTVPSQHIDEALEIVSPAQQSQRPLLMIRVAQDLTSDGFTLDWDYFDEYGDPLVQRDPLGGLTAPDGLVDAVVAAVQSLPGGAPCEPQIEVQLPFNLLADETFLDALERAPYRSRLRTGEGRIPGSRASRPAARLGAGDLAADFPLVLRCWERWNERLLVNDRGATKLRAHWAEHAPRCLMHAADSPCLVWLKPEPDQNLRDAARARMRPPPRKPAALALSHDQALPSPELEDLLDEGVPILLWPRLHGPAPSQLKELKRLFREESRRRIQDLPHLLHKHRESELSPRRRQTCDFSLLWDTPDRLGLEQPDHDPSVLDPNSQ